MIFLKIKESIKIEIKMYKEVGVGSNMNKNLKISVNDSILVTDL